MILNPLKLAKPLYDLSKAKVLILGTTAKIAVTQKANAAYTGSITGIKNAVNKIPNPFVAIRSAYDTFEDTLEEANYLAEPRSILNFFGFGKKKLPETTGVTVSTKMLDTSETVGRRFMWGAIFAALTIKTLMVTAGLLTLAGCGILGVEYMRAKRVREEEIIEVNFAGQRVKGTRADLCRLHKAQVNIMNLATVFKKASLESTSDTIQHLIDGVAEERKRVHVMDAGPYGAVAGVYDFSRPAISLVNQDERKAGAPLQSLSSVPGMAICMAATMQNDATPVIVDAAQPMIFDRQSRKLSESFRTKRAREEQIVEQLIEMQRDLSPALRRRIQRGLYN